MKPKGFLIIVVAIAAFGLYLSAFVVNETQQVVVTQFGKVVGNPIKDPGLKFKLPLVQKATYFPKTLLAWDGEPGQIPTLEKTYIWVDTFALWRIVDPVKFFQTVGNMMQAKDRLDEIIDPSVRNAITSYNLIEAVRKSNRPLTFEEGTGAVTEQQQAAYHIKVGREKITRQILTSAQSSLDEFGIELVDVKIKRINYVKEVRKSVYDRMIAERTQIAEKYRAEGKGEAQKILGNKERDLKQIQSDAYKKAQEVKGKADAEATRIYAEAYGVDPAFYSFSKTLDTYEKTLDKSNSLILSTDSDFFKYLKEYDPEKNK